MSKAYEPKIRIMEAYDSNGDLIAWTDIPRPACMPVDDEVAKAIYMRETGAASVRILE